MRHIAEFVLPGHPDKLCDAIADALVEEAARREKRALCGIEVAVHRAAVFLTGRVACAGAEAIDVEGIVRSIYTSAGYGGEWIPDASGLNIRLDLCVGPLLDGEAELRRIADDQSIVTGYAVDLPGTNFLPPEHWLASRMARRLERLRLQAPELLLGPDGKLILAWDEVGGSSRVTAFSASVQQAFGGSLVDLHRAVLGELRAELRDAAPRIPGLDPELPELVSVNGAGNFAVGGPEGDNGLSGKKLVVDAYGPRVPIGGGALSGKDFYKADRAGALIARRIAKAVVRTGVARECTVTLGIFPGDEAFEIISMIDGSGVSLETSRWAAMLDLSLAGTGDRHARVRNLVGIARHGHFTNPENPWERVGFDGMK